jgi:hypothetical protein
MLSNATMTEPLSNTARVRQREIHHVVYDLDSYRHRVNASFAFARNSYFRYPVSTRTESGSGFPSALCLRLITRRLVIATLRISVHARTRYVTSLYYLQANAEK